MYKNDSYFLWSKKVQNGHKSGQKAQSGPKMKPKMIQKLFKNGQKLPKQKNLPKILQHMGQKMVKIPHSASVPRTFLALQEGRVSQSSASVLVSLRTAIAFVSLLLTTTLSRIQTLEILRRWYNCTLYHRFSCAQWAKW